MAVQIIIRNPLDRDAREYMSRAGVADAAARTQINEFVRGMRSLGLWDKCVCWPLRSAQNAGTGTTAHSLGGMGAFPGTLTNGPTWETDGVQFATDATTGRNRLIVVPWSTVGGHDVRANSTVVLVSNFGEVVGAGANYDQYMLGSRETANGGYGALSTRNQNTAGSCTVNALINIGNDNMVPLTNQTLPSAWRMWSVQRENNDGANSNTSGNKLYRDASLVGSGSNSAKTPYGSIPNASEVLNIGNARGNTSLATVGKISFVAVIADWTASVSAIRALYVATLGQGVLS